jgi:hypothetical protein
MTTKARIRHNGPDIAVKTNPIWLFGDGPNGSQDDPSTKTLHGTILFIFGRGNFFTPGATFSIKG